jgi:hypothetical protein
MQHGGSTSNPATSPDGLDAFLVVIDRQSFNAGRTGALIRSLVHATQKPYFDLWASGVITPPIVVFGRLWPREASGGRPRTQLPINFCRDARPLTMILVRHSTEAKLALSSVIKSAYVVRLSNPAQQREILSALASLPSVSMVSDFDGEASK